ncbi:MAG: hypothetical protein ACRDBY_07980 [Cetobacterium sp.]
MFIIERKCDIMGYIMALNYLCDNIIPLHQELRERIDDIRLHQVLDKIENSYNQLEEYKDEKDGKYETFYDNLTIANLMNDTFETLSSDFYLKNRNIVDETRVNLVNKYVANLETFNYLIKSEIVNKKKKEELNYSNRTLNNYEHISTGVPVGEAVPKKDRLPNDAYDDLKQYIYTRGENKERLPNKYFKV